MTDTAPFSWTVLLPVKVLARAKSRLAVLAGDRRGDLALALASDTAAAVLACPEVTQVMVITSDLVAGPRLAALGAVVVPDEPADRRGDSDRATHGDLGLGVQDGLNAALRYGAAVAAARWPGTGLAALAADLPALRPDELAIALRAAAAVAGPAFVPDAAGVGTTLYAVPRGGEFRPLFGGASRARHASSGAVELDTGRLGPGRLAGLRRDVDTPDDLRTALGLGAGPRTTDLATVLLASA
jgi:2-phospho-L-lactate/phosphoenolpyruvate guanylyltransferase